MQDESSYWIQSVSVVVTAEFHNPSILNPDFLRGQEIVPMSWKTAQQITTPQFSNLRFENGIDWTVDQSKLAVSENCESGDRNEYRTYGLVIEYLRKLPHVPYRNLGLNCVVAVRKQNPQRWLTQRFLRDGIWSHSGQTVFDMVPKFVIDPDGGPRYTLSLRAGKSKLGGENAKPSVIADCNIHHQGPHNVDSLCRAINRWRERKEFVLVTLRGLLGDCQS